MKIHHSAKKDSICYVSLEIWDSDEEDHYIITKKEGRYYQAKYETGTINSFSKSLIEETDKIQLIIS